MSLYDTIINKIKQISEYDKEDEAVASITASSTLTAEITLLSSILVVVIMLRYFNNALMIISVLLVAAITIFAMPIMPKLRREQNDSLNSMVFYVILALGIIAALFYWGNINV